MSKILQTILLSITLAITTALSFTPQSADAHLMVTPEIMEFLESNPNVTQEEFEKFMVDTYGEEILKDMYGYQPDEDHAANRIIAARTEGQTPVENAKNFTILGIEHILIGLDHILFVIALILTLAPWRTILKMVTAFTVAHSLTLILAGTQVLTLSSKIVEPIIALSIAYVAITSVFFKHIKAFQKAHSTIAVIFLFGLFHGLGFAGVFSDLSIPQEHYVSSLLFYNVGVEIGQLTILAVALPTLHALNANKKVFNIATEIIATGISFLAVYWAIQRIFF